MKIAIIEESVMVRNLFKNMCTEQFGYRVISESADGISAVNNFQHQHPNILLLNLDLPKLDGVCVAEIARERYGPSLKIIVVSRRRDVLTIRCLQKLDIDGFVDLTSEGLTTMSNTIKDVSIGRKALSVTYIKALNALRNDPIAYYKILSKREQNILHKIALLLSDEEISFRESLSARTVECHRFKIMAKLGIDTRLQLLRYAYLHGFGNFSNTNTVFTKKDVDNDCCIDPKRTISRKVGGVLLKDLRTVV